VTGRVVSTARLRTNLWDAGSDEGGGTVVLVHGNLSSGAVWREQLGLLPAGVRGIAPDLRGFGESEPAPVDARRGVRDYSDDVLALIEALELGPVHLAGHSLGGGVAMQVAIDRPELVRSLALVAPVSPFGFGGTGADGTPHAPDHAGSGGGCAAPELVQRLREGDRGTEHQLSPRNVIRTLFFPSPDAVRDEEEILAAMFATRIGDDHYPGDATPSEHWPGVAPGERGVLNAVSSRHCDLTALADGRVRGVPVLWVRADRDAVISDASLVDLGHLGALGAVPGWPGEDVCPAQPMVAQTRALLARYDGPVREEVLEDTGHFAFTQRPERFAALLAEQLRSAG